MADSEPWHWVEQQRDVPKMALAGYIPWNNKYFIPQGASMEHELLFRKIYWRYFKQICDTHGFDIDIYPGKAWAATYVPYIDFRKEIDLLMDLAKHAIQDYNNTSNDDYKYKVMWIEKVNYFVGEGREFLMTVKVENLTCVHL
ncbi:uncharacterized protein LOC132602670 [Lycium barbarum]|uniref:uncharacterized protein LOC132602670 n=1 Tax=Lycium barbarum TaxID=112863 RepID=UPI00293EE3AB|nr:uncharacterized protein LOC132602670 [Lycium barbarum]